MNGDNSSVPPEKDRQWSLIENLVGGILVEQRRSRRWGIFFKLLTFFYLFLFLVYVIAMAANMNIGKAAKGNEYTAVINVAGVISADEQASADNIVSGLRAAFEDKAAKAVVLRINSPGGSPVQSGYVYDEINRLRELHPDKKVYAVITDLGASAAYYIASAADEIYADKGSLVGSIGVVASGFGFVDAIDKLGVTRRVYTSGQHKGFLDPFLPPKAEETEFWQDVLNTVHTQFINSVKEGRGDRLKENPKLFSGLVWSGEQAVTLGLVDGLGSTSYVAREVVGAEELVDFTPQENPIERFAKQLGTSIGLGISQKLGVNSSIKLQ